MIIEKKTRICKRCGINKKSKYKDYCESCYDDSKESAELVKLKIKELEK